MSLIRIQPPDNHYSTADILRSIHRFSTYTNVASTIIGYFYQSLNDAIARYSLPPILIHEIAPEVIIIPVKVLADYYHPATSKRVDPQIMMVMEQPVTEQLQAYCRLMLRSARFHGFCIDWPLFGFIGFLVLLKIVIRSAKCK